MAVADPGFPRGGGANSPGGGGGAPTYDFAKISQKLHEIERIWTPRGGGRASKILLCRSATAWGRGRRVRKGSQGSHTPWSYKNTPPPQKKKTATKPLCRFSGSATEILHNQRYHEKNNFKSKN